MLALRLYLALAANRTRVISPRMFKLVAEGLQEHADEPLGQYDARPKGDVVWFHTATVEAMRPLGDLIQSMADERPGLNFLITVQGEAERRFDAKAYDGQTHIVHVPDDTHLAVQRFLNHWSPKAGIFIGIDLRPALINGAVQAGVPLMSIDGPRANPNWRRFRWWPGLRGTLMQLFERHLVGDKTGYERRRRAGAPTWSIEEIGFLEESAQALPYIERERSALADLLGTRPRWLASGIAAEEEAAVLSAHRMALRRSHRLLLIVVPKNADRIDAIIARSEKMGFMTASRREGGEPTQDCQVYVAEGEGEMGLWYRLSSISFLGNSLNAGGGQPPYEAAALGSAIVHGPNVSGYRSAYARLSAARATVLVRNETELSHAVETLQSPDRAAVLAHAAWEAASSGAEVGSRVIKLVFDALDRHSEPA